MIVIDDAHLSQVDVLVLLEAGSITEVLELPLVSYGSQEPFSPRDILLTIAANLWKRNSEIYL